MSLIIAYFILQLKFVCQYENRTIESSLYELELIPGKLTAAKECTKQLFARCKGCTDNA